MALKNWLKKAAKKEVPMENTGDEEKGKKAKDAAEQGDGIKTAPEGAKDAADGTDAGKDTKNIQTDESESDPERDEKSEDLPEDNKPPKWAQELIDAVKTLTEAVIKTQELPKPIADKKDDEEGEDDENDFYNL